MEPVHERFDQLESQMQEYCEIQQNRDQTEQANHQQLTAELNELRLSFTELRTDISRMRPVAAEPSALPPACPAPETNPNSKLTLGRIEWVDMPDIGTYLRARVDTGANTSSLSAREITRFQRNGRDWVRFKLGLTSGDAAVPGAAEKWIEARIERRVRIIQATGEESRLVVRLMTAVGPVQDLIEYTLTDRSHLDYPVLLGRGFLMDIAVVDVSESYLHPRAVYEGVTPPAEAEELEDTDEIIEP